jgi:4-hydroxy-2-oxoheptanedioate aldolase
MTDRLRARWSSGEVALNAWLARDDPDSAAAIAGVGFDAAVVDLQHGAASMESLAPIFAAIEPTGAVPFVRVRWNDPGLVMRCLDLGARGVICPMVNTPEEAETFARACRYPPLGDRSYGPVRGAFGIGRGQTEPANSAVLAFAQIETAEALAGVAEIAATPGLDGLYVGPADLSLTLGLDTFADVADPRMLEALDRILRAAAETGIVPGIHAPSVEGACAMADRGFRFIGAATDGDEGAAADALRRIRAALGDG